MNLLDLLIVNVPGTISLMPPAAPAVLKASVVQAGFTCKTIDFNARLYSEKHIDIQNLETYFATGINTDAYLIADQLVKRWAIEIISYDPKFVGISVFTYQNQTATRLFCKHIKENSDIKIILGGLGLIDGGILGTQSFAKDMLNQNLSDFYIKIGRAHV